MPRTAGPMPANGWAFALAHRGLVYRLAGQQLARWRRADPNVTPDELASVALEKLARNVGRANRGGFAPATLVKVVCRSAWVHHFRTGLRRAGKLRRRGLRDYAAPARPLWSDAAWAEPLAGLDLVDITLAVAVARDGCTRAEAGRRAGVGERSAWQRLATLGGGGELRRLLCGA